MKVSQLIYVAVILALASGQRYYISQRKDYYLDNNKYPEDMPIPSSGGRVQIVVPLIQPGVMPQSPFTVQLSNGQYSQKIASTEGLNSVFEWVWAFTSGYKTAVVNFHTRNDDLFYNVRHVKLLDNAGVVFADIDIGQNNAQHPLTLTYVTVTADYKSIVIHVHNYDKSNWYSISMIEVNGDLYQVNYGLCPECHTVFTYGLPSAKEGDTWTVGLVLDNGIQIGNGGRIVKPFYPIETWPKSNQCPYPDSNGGNYNTLKNAFAIDTMYFDSGECGDQASIINNAPNYNYYLLVGDGTLNNAAGGINTYAGVLAVSVGDEVDNGPDKAAQQWTHVTQQREKWATLSMFQGGHVNHYIGAYAGITDIQGMDFYVACCAPHITKFTSNMRIQGAYDYIRVTKDNNMPLPTWGYSQFLSDNWKTHLNTPEVIVQLASVVAAGAQGMMLFQADVSWDQSSDSWSKAGKFLKMLASIKSDLQLGSADGTKFTTSDVGNDQSITSIIRTPQNLYIVVINTKCDSYNAQLCEVGISAKWNCHSHGISQIQLTIPAGFQWDGQFYEVFEDGPHSTSLDHNISGDQLTIQNIALDQDFVTRIFQLRQSQSQYQEFLR